MYNLPMQPRVKSPSLEGDESYDTREGRMLTKKAASFKGERKKAQNWFQRQFSGQNCSDEDFAAAVAASAYAISSLKEEGPMNQEKSTEFEGLERKARSKREASMLKPTDSSKILRRLSGKETKEDGKSTGDISIRRSSTFDKKALEETMPDRKQPGKAMGTTPSIKKTPTFSDKYLNDTGSKSYGGEKETKAGPTSSQSMIPVAYAFDKEKDRKSMGSSIGETEADAWQKKQKDKIKERYEETNSTILEWENENKMKAKCQLELKERELEIRQERALQKYHDKIARIDTVASAARAIAEERKKNAELKVLEKAKVLRDTGKLPRTCFCF